MKKTISIGIALVMVLTTFVSIGGNILADPGPTTLKVDDKWQVGPIPYAEDTDGDKKFATIQAAIDAASPGDTIKVKPGIYTEYLIITTDGLTIKGAGIRKSIIDLDGLEPYWHYPGCSKSYASRAGVLISGYGSPDQIIEDVTFKGFTVKNAGRNPPITATGTHTGSNNAAVLTDSTKSWTPNALVGQWVHNYGDRDTDYNPVRSYGQITRESAETWLPSSWRGIVECFKAQGWQP